MEYLNKPFFKFLIGIALVFAPVKQMLITAFCLVLADMLFGIFAARKRKDPITSAGLGRTLVKIFVYSMSICLGFLTEHYLTGGTFPILSIITSLIGLTEIKSILENLNEISGTDLLRSILDKLSSVNYKKKDEPNA